MVFIPFRFLTLLEAQNARLSAEINFAVGGLDSRDVKDHLLILVQRLVQIRTTTLEENHPLRLAVVDHNLDVLNLALDVLREESHDVLFSDDVLAEQRTIIDFNDLFHKLYIFNIDLF